VLSVGSDSRALSHSLLCGNTLGAGCSEVDLIAAQLEPSLVKDGAADMVTCMYGLHLLDIRQALLETHRMLRPGGKFVVAFNDRWGTPAMPLLLLLHCSCCCSAAARALTLLRWVTASSGATVGLVGLAWRQ
jgi:hypothetical protein